MKRSKKSKLVLTITSLLSIATIASVSSAVADTATPSPSSSISSPTKHSSPQAGRNNLRNAAREAARTAFNFALKQAQNGRDLAFADANANLLQSIQVAGKDKNAKLAARSEYKSAAKGIISAFKQAVATANQNYKAALALIK